MQLFAGVLTSILGAQAAHAQENVACVWVIDMENRNWTQPASDTGAPAQIYGSSAAPYINSLVTPGHPERRDGFLRQPVSPRPVHPERQQPQHPSL